jgi:hypothetical protein
MEILHKAGHGCRPERKWLAGPYVWGEIRFQLREKSHPLYDSDEMPHPDTAARARAGFALNSENWHAQREEVELTSPTAVPSQLSPTATSIRQELLSRGRPA